MNLKTMSSETSETLKVTYMIPFMSHPEQVNPDRERSMGHSVGLFKLK